MTDFEALRRDVRNWGRWGPADERGTLNLLTSDAARRGAAAVRRGAAMSLAGPLGARGPSQLGRPYGRINPVRTMTAVNHPLTDHPQSCSYSDDIVTMGVQCATHWDALPHVSHDGQIYNGAPAATIGPAGAGRCAIDTWPAVVGRGVLLDVARVHGLERLPADHTVREEDLDAALALAGVVLEAGDIVLVRTGQITLLTRECDATAYARPAPGLDPRTARWFRRHDVAALAADTLAVERPYQGDLAEVGLPLHVLALVDMGMPLGENFDLEDLAVACADDGSYEFLLSASPLPLEGSTGGAVNPVAIK